MPNSTPPTLGYISYAPQSEVYHLHRSFPRKQQRQHYDIEEILEGQYSSLYISLETFSTFFNKELQALEQDLLKVEYQAHRYLFPNPPSQDTFGRLMAFGFALMHVPLYQSWENEDALRTALLTLTGCSVDDFYAYREAAHQRCGISSSL